MNSQIYQKLVENAKILENLHLRDMFNEDPNRFDKFSIKWNDWLIDYSKQLLNNQTLDLLNQLSKNAKIDDWQQKMQSGEKINTSENRPVLHCALRKKKGELLLNGENVLNRVNSVLHKVECLIDDVTNGIWLGSTNKKITDIVNIGIGGSDLGPRMATFALSKYWQPGIKVHFVANLDGTDLTLVLKDLNPETTLFIIASKTFTTQETMQNAISARQWVVNKLGDESVSQHFVAVSTNINEVIKFGINPENTFEFWDWVGGRFSICSAIGLPLAMAIGYKNFHQLLLGAESMDEHFFNTPFSQNLPVILSLIEIWNTNFLGCQSRAILPYSQSLSYLPRFIQQLEMESNGKRVDRQGEFINYQTSPIIWGEVGTNGQHAFYQLIHQGKIKIPCEFILFKKPDYHFENSNSHHAKLLANCFAQSEALMKGKTKSEVEAELAGYSEKELQLLIPNKTFAGNQPSTTIVIPELNPFNLGALIALYEHKVFVSGIIWNINSFDQWGVELGKVLANRLLPMIERTEAITNLDSSTAGLINFIHN